MPESSSTFELTQIDETFWEISAPARPDMRVPARVFADSELAQAITRDESLGQLQNVATLPGVVGAALAMPDIHQGYGFPVGGVAAMELPDGVVSPGGVGYDINCGVRLLALSLTESELGARREAFVHEIARSVPAGAGKERGRSRDRADLERVLREGSRVLDPAAEAFGLREEQVTVLIHSGSRGLGHQVCTDFVKLMDEAMRRYGIELPDRQLACCPASSPEGQAYLGAMAASANFAWTNRQAIADAVRQAVERVLGTQVANETRQVYDVAHNVAKEEEYDGRRVLVHRKGATRAFPAGSGEIPEAYRDVGQPVFIPGSMGTASYVLAGEPGSMTRSFGTTCHGAGRTLSRTAARKRIAGGDLRRELEAQGIVVRCPSPKGLAEEAPFAYKDVERVVEVVERAGLARRVARLVPLGVVKG